MAQAESIEVAIYHYTDTARLPWILADRELRPGTNRIGGFPDPDLLWATTSALGDRTASLSQQALRAGVTRLVRFVLDEADFDHWEAVLADLPSWEPRHKDALVKAAIQGGLSLADIDGWRARTTPLPEARWASIETRTWADKRWIALPNDTRAEASGKANVAGVRIAGRTYWYERLASDPRTGAQAFTPVQVLGRP